jgi:hypothetical protein
MFRISFWTSGEVHFAFLKAFSSTISLYKAKILSISRKLPTHPRSCHTASHRPTDHLALTDVLRSRAAFPPPSAEAAPPPVLRRTHPPAFLGPQNNGALGKHRPRTPETLTLSAPGSTTTAAGGDLAAGHFPPPSAPSYSLSDLPFRNPEP